MDAYAVATIFDLPYEVGPNSAWSKLVQASEIADLTIHALLHCSWHVSVSYSLSALDERLMSFTQSSRIFDVHTVGLGMFTAASPVLYLPIVKTPELAKLHQDLWEHLLPVSTSLVMYYAPPNWMPHITLSDEYAEVERMCQFKQSLLFEPLSFSFRVDHMAVIFRNGSEEGVVKKFMFGGVH
jgi:2'-5' RNA ligase